MSVFFNGTVMKSPAGCEIRAVLRVLVEKTRRTTKINCEIRPVFVKSSKMLSLFGVVFVNSKIYS